MAALAFSTVQPVSILRRKNTFPSSASSAITAPPYRSRTSFHRHVHCTMTPFEEALHHKSLKQSSIPSRSAPDANLNVSVDSHSSDEHSTLYKGNKSSEVSNLQPGTRAVRGGMHQSEWTTDPYGRSVVNPPVYHASTVTFPTVASLRYASSDWPFTGLWYGRHGNPTTFALEDAFAAIEGAHAAALTSSGVAAVNASLLAFVKAGDHVFITDAVYDPTRDFCDYFLNRFGVSTTYYSPTITPQQFDDLFQAHPNTTAVLVETPASLSFEVMDVPALAKVAKAHGAVVIADNTWGPLLFSPFENGVDVSVNAATKYIGGHSDLMMGIIGARNADLYRAVKKSVVQLGCPPGTDDAYLALRGLRTLHVRMKQHGESGIKVAKWLENRPEVARVLHPGLESHPQYELFRKLFTAPSGLFGFQLRKGFSQQAVDFMIDGMKLHALGFSWGGFESLLMQTRINQVRSVDKWDYDNFGQTMRIHVGLEDVADLISDLEQGFERLNSYEKDKDNGTP